MKLFSKIVLGLDGLARNFKICPIVYSDRTRHSLIDLHFHLTEYDKREGMENVRWIGNKLSARDAYRQGENLVYLSGLRAKELQPKRKITMQ